MSNDCPTYYKIDAQHLEPIEAELKPFQPTFGPVLYVIAFNERGEAELIVRRDLDVDEEEPHPEEWATYKRIAGEVVPSHGVPSAQPPEEAVVPSHGLASAQTPEEAVVPSHGLASAQTPEEADRYTYIRVDNLGSHHVGCGKNSGGRICCNIVHC
jgi:hypothetical protein